MSHFDAGGDMFQSNSQDFDLNIDFEQVFFSIIPSVLFILSSIWRASAQWRRPNVVDAPVLQLLKLGFITTYIGLELSLVVVAAVGSVRVSGLFTAASVLKLVSSFVMVMLSLMDHSKSVRPSILLSGYLALSLLLDIAQARTLFLSSADAKPELTYSALFAIALGLKLVILLLEAQQKPSQPEWDEKKHSPEETSGLFSLGVFFWLNQLFLRGYQRVLRLSDLYPLDVALDTTHLHSSFTSLTNHKAPHRGDHSLLASLIQTLWVPLILPVAPRLAHVGFTFCQPLFIERLLQYLAEPDPDKNTGYGLIAASIVIYAGIAFSNAICWYYQRRMLAMLRSILVTEIFVHATMTQTGAGSETIDDNAALTLMSTDMERIELGFRMVHDIWASAVQVGLAAWMLHRQLGKVFLAPMVIVTVCFLALGVLMRMTGDSQRSWMAQVQRRVGLTATVIANMKSLKLSGLTSPVASFVQELRVVELAAGARFRMIYIAVATLGFVPLFFSPPLTFALAQKDIDATTIFTSLAYILLLTNPLCDIFQIIPQLMAAIACVGRIQNFLATRCREDPRQIGGDVNLSRCLNRLPSASSSNSRSSGHSAVDVPAAITVNHTSFAWKQDLPVLRNLTFQIRQSALTMVIGPVGSGKSTLCRALLGEMPYNTGGTITMSTRTPHVGFCDQSAFLCNGSIRDNIVGFSQFDEERYRKVLQATCLIVDLALLPQNDLTNIGSSGITLSGGQKQRVSLARALYLHTDLLVLDDILTGLDADTEEQVFRQVFGPAGLLSNRQSTVVLCAHSTRHLPSADHIIVLNDGVISEQGSYQELMGSEGYVNRLGLADLGVGKSTLSIEVAPAVQSTPSVTTFNLGSDPVEAQEQYHQSSARQVGDRSVYKHYMKSMGISVVVAALMFATSFGFFTNFPTIWLKFWAEDVHSQRPVHTFAYYVGVFTALQASCLVSLLLLGLTIYIVSIKRAGASLHQEALSTLLRAPLRFFTSTDNGVVTNLFSQDLNLVDTELPTTMVNVLFTLSTAVGAAAVMLSATPYMGIAYPFLGVVMYVVQRFYLRTSRQLRLLDLETKSPLYTHFLDTINGITTLRAFGFISDDIHKNARLLNDSQRPAYLLVMVQQWLNLVLELVVMGLAAVLTALAIQLRSSSGFTGAALVSLMTFGEKLTGIVIYYTRLETSMGAIARLKDFQDTVQPEDRDDEDLVMPEAWPEQGTIELGGVSATYEAPSRTAQNSKLALRQLQLTIRAGEKVAICGRTGSGKSSLVAFLLKLLDPIPGMEGAATIDGTPLHRISRQNLRQRIIAVPQEAVFLPDGTSYKVNLDPTGASAPEECQNVLEKVGLWSFVEQRGGLNAGMSASKLSAGQRQLMSLGRALLRRRIRSRHVANVPERGAKEGGILLLDEVSSSVDHQTERVMQDIIRDEFEGYTIVAVSHRLDMIMDFDKVVVMEAGSIIEKGRPSVLAEEAVSRFGELVAAAAK